MSINRVPIGGVANNQYHGQGQFCYYRKGSAVSGVTDVAVYVDSAYMGLMSPTEHFKLNTKGVFWEFKPVDPLLVGEFVLADTAEEYGSSAVAGSVSITSLPDNNQLISESATAYCCSGAAEGAISNPRAYYANALGATKKAYIEELDLIITGTFTSIYVDVLSYSGGAFSMAGGNADLQPINDFPPHAKNSGVIYSLDASGVTGLTDLGRIFSFSSAPVFPIKFEKPLILGAGELLGVIVTGTSTYLSFPIKFHMK